MAEYIVNYEVRDASGNVVGDGTTLATYKDESVPIDKEIKEALESQLQFALEVKVTSLTPNG